MEAVPAAANVSVIGAGSANLGKAACKAAPICIAAAWHGREGNVIFVSQEAMANSIVTESVADFLAICII